MCLTILPLHATRRSCISYLDSHAFCPGVSSFPVSTPSSIPICMPKVLYPQITMSVSSLAVDVGEKVLHCAHSPKVLT